MKILVPNDYSVPGTLACRFAADTALMNDGEVLVMKTAQSFFAPELLHEEFNYDHRRGGNLTNEYRRYYTRLFNEYADSRSANLVIERGPVTIIAPALQLIRDQHVDLIIAGTNGDFINEDFIGIDTALHFGSAPVPLLTVRKGSKSESIRDIVFPISMRTDQAEFVLRARSIQEMYGGRMHLLLIKSQSFNPSDVKAAYFVEAFARHYRILNYVSAVKTGTDETASIIEYALDADADMILWGRK